MSLNKYNATTGELENIASGQRTWVGTRAAYDTAKQAGTLPTNALICITDDEEDYCHYSTEETKTGNYWIDGKPIYRKVVVLTSNIASGSNIPISSNIDMLVDFGGTGYFGPNRYYRQFPWIAGSYMGSLNGYNSTSAQYFANADTGVLGSGSKIWFEYTKTTD